MPDRAALAGILFVLTTGIGWNDLPAELGCGSGTTCWRRLQAWQRAGVWNRLHRAVLDRLGQARDPGLVPSHVLCDRNGLPLHALVSGANIHDSRMLTELLDTNPGVREQRGRPGRPRRRPEKLHADKGYDYPRCRRYLTRRGIGVRIARRGVEDSTRLGRVRWVVERTMAWLLSYRRLALRYERSRTSVEALLTLACALICLRRLP